MTEPEPSWEPEAEARARWRPGPRPEEAAPSEAYTPRPRFEEERRADHRWRFAVLGLLYLAAVLAVHRANQKAAPAAAARGGVRLWVSDPDGEHGDVAEVRVNGVPLRQVRLTPVPPTIDIPDSFGRSPLIEVVVVEDGGDGAHLHVAADAPLYTYLRAMRPAKKDLSAWVPDETARRPWQLWGLEAYDERVKAGFKKTLSTDPGLMKAREAGL